MPDDHGGAGVVHIVAPFGRDADSIATVLRSAGLGTQTAPQLTALAAAIDEHAGAVLVTEEAVAGGTEALLAALSTQPAWSDLPFILLRSPRAHRRSPTDGLLPRSLNVVELDRPLGSISLLSAVQGALRARQKQYLVRDQMQALADSRVALVRSESELRLIADAMPVLIAFIDRSLHYRFANKAYEAWFERPVGEVIGQHVSAVIGADAWEQRMPAMNRALAGHETVFETTWPHRDGRRRDVEVRYSPRLLADGSADGFHVFVTDITVSKLALEDSRQHAQELEVMVAERTRELEAQMAAREASESALRQAQKMEAIGQLTGGIAHDFNNMLTGILSALDIVRMRLEMGRTDDLHRFLDTATASSQRAAGLTQRLLAFARRQSLDAKPLELNALVGSVLHLLRTTLGETVRLDTRIAPTPLHATLDANQFESALLNLAINARDAMPHGGALVLRTSAVHMGQGEHASIPAGHYAVVAVSDTGTGMPPEVVERAFEPFFTTKPIGKGTGLGMSMVYGFMQQSGGHIAIDSAPGQGTTVSLYIPLAQAPAAPAEPAAAAVVSLGAGQSILVVEDDEQVRMLVTVVLEDLGYQVEVVGDADAAIPLLASPRVIDLLITDVGLPGLNGRQLAEIARQSRPVLPILFMTGYAEKAQERSAFLEPGMAMIAKPFLLDEFSAAVRKALADGHEACVA
ncbi:hybrid sensor histidine kinase/response regulator [Stenotrophomonas rhizophila]|uniref:hybrid sensor histidine kinase/response regulator n=1 Tax=Stenotrophomonas rhizophila TaxID=216778 RepID=UPI001E54DE45|nr:PAS domain-containing sensor histidine kinase [Stenotrophomonas rhizophila]MCC7634593.1 PAS domain-containing protein [Stenotrophomonas rhizophila]MCC7664138.1 PAS domain-containing protein [Stenotrophomonas rhizophila]